MVYTYTLADRFCLSRILPKLRRTKIATSESTEPPTHDTFHRSYIGLLLGMWNFSYVGFIKDLFYKVPSVICIWVW